MFQNRQFLVLSTVILIAVSVAAVRSGDIFFQIKQQLTIFSDVYKEVATLYVDEIPPGTLMKNSIESMLKTLDPYSTFVDEGEQQQMEILSTGNYGGIGIDAGFRDNKIVVIAPFEGYPAERAGIRPGDIILTIDGADTDGMSPEEVQRLTIGDIGTKINIDIERRGIDQVITFELERERIEVSNIKYSELIGEDSDIAYIQLTRFGQNASEELRRQLYEYKEGNRINGLILDLRNNPGGLLNEAVEIVDKFIGPGEAVVETRGRLRDQSAIFYSEEPPLFEDLPVVVLLNNGSASASEVVAGALQDLDRAVIVGETSFGKGLVQTIRPLSYNRSLRLTVSRYYTPSGRSIQSVDYNYHNENRNQAIPDSLRAEFKTRNGRTVFGGMGIEPDILVQTPNVSLLETALQQQNQYFFFISDFIADRSIDSESRMPDNLFEEFTIYLKEQGFDYQTSADQHLEELEKVIDNFSDSQVAAENLRELEKLVQEQKAAALEDSREQIDKLLQLEWISGTKGESQKVKASLPIDSYVIESLIILADQEGYKKILNN